MEGQRRFHPEKLRYVMNSHCCRDTMGRLLQRSGNATSLPYIFLPGNHEVHTLEWTCKPNCLASILCASPFMHFSLHFACLT